MTGGQGFAHVSSRLQPIFGAPRDQASDVILTGIPEQQSAKSRVRRISDQPKRGKTAVFSNCSPLTWIYLLTFRWGPLGQVEAVLLISDR